MNTISKRSVQSKIVYMNSLYQLPISAIPGFEKEIEWQKKLYPMSELEQHSEGREAASISNAQFYIGQRLVQLKKILMDEVAEVDDIILGVSTGQRYKKGVPVFRELKSDLGNSQDAVGYDKLDALTDLADLMADITVYCRSEMERVGLPYDEIMHIVMDSNFSKLDAEGKPIIKEGKFQKGPFYWAPEEKIGKLIRDLIAGG